MAALGMSKKSSFAKFYVKEDLQRSTRRLTVSWQENRSGIRSISLNLLLLAT